MKRLAVLLILGIFLFLGLVIGNLIAAEQIDILGVTVKQDVLIMFGFGLATLVGLSIYDVFAAFGTFRRYRDQERQIKRLEDEILNSKQKPS